MSTFLEPSFTGPPVATHSYLLPFKEGNLLVDAPAEAAAFFERIPIAGLFITHAHFDHVLDAAAIAVDKGCHVYMSRKSEELLADTSYLRRFGIDFEVPPLRATHYLEEGENQEILGENISLFDVSGHCPGSLALYWPAGKVVCSGDSLFQGVVGRWDLPGANKEELLTNIKEKLLPLPPQTHVLPGHGAMTTIGAERELNPFLS